ncbi:MAG TPA: hypothetical protein PK683_16955, partial [Leptospiraceae bacterium]|nr:hypothetical protein [Leptospiraceae bacterium]
MRISRNYLSVQDQLLRGIEQLALGWFFIHKTENEKKKVPMDLIISILEEAYSEQDGSSEEETDYLSRRYKNYREKLEEKPYQVKTDFQKKIIQNFKGNEDGIRNLAKLYLENYAEDYSDYILENYLKIQKQNGLLEYSLFA